MSRFCKQCGAQLEPNENFCPSCGAKVIRDEQPTYTPPPTSTPVNSTASPEENNAVKFLLLIGILVLIGVGGYFVRNPSTTPKLYNTSWTVGNMPPNYKGVIENGYGCAIYSINYYKYINSNYGYNHTARGMYNVVTCIVENKTSTAVSDFQIILVDKNNVEHFANADATSTYDIMNNINNPRTLEAWQAYFYCQVFDIPEGIEITSLRFKCNHYGGFYIPFRVVTEY